MSARAVAAPPPFPFFVGCGRSGTTLLRAMVDSHPEVAVPDEVAFIIRYRRPHRALQYGWPRRFDAAACTDLILADRSFRRWPVTDAEARAALADPPPASFADTVRRLYALMAAVQGKPRYADKTPSHVLYLPRLARLFPEARFVHLIRDGRDVALSYQSVAWGPTTVPEAAIRWRRSVRRGRRDGLRLGPDRYREIRYEDLVADPERVLRELCPFLRIDWDESMLHYHRRADAVIAATRFPEAHQRLLLPPERGLRDWRTEMAPEDIEGFEAIAGELLDELGYGRARERPSLPRRLSARGRIVADAATRSWRQAGAGGRALTRSVAHR
jgi:Sulfotransferase family